MLIPLLFALNTSAALAQSIYLDKTWILFDAVPRTLVDDLRIEGLISVEDVQFEMAAGAGDEHNDLFYIRNNALRSQAPLEDYEGQTLTVRLTAALPSGDNLENALTISVVSEPPVALLTINEALASNQNGLQDGFGENSDWLELWNPNGQPLNLAGYYLTDDPEDPTKWPLPSVELAADAYLVIFASGRALRDGNGNPVPDASGYFHASFRIDADGEYLAATFGGGDIVHEFSPALPPQRSDVSYGLDANRNLRYFTQPTPGSPNGDGVEGILRSVQFSVERGFHDGLFQVALSAGEEGAQIRYTLDGSEPSVGQGNLYTQPISISTTSTLRALAYKPDRLPSPVETHTYLFLDDVARQSERPSGWPEDWGTDGEVPGRVAADYEMDPRVVENTEAEYGIRDALLDIPSLSMVMPLEDFIGPTQGIYTHPLSRGGAWEKPVSLEWIRPDGSTGFQADAQVEIHGNSSRRPWRMQKHSMRLTFVDEIGPGRLDFPLFADSPVESFNQLVLRGCFTDSWGLVSWGASRYRPNDSQYVRDVWMKESWRNMGHASTYGDWIHLYVNGLYWGIYNITERFDEDFLSDHLGGAPEDWEVVEDLTSNPSGWRELMSRARGDIESPEVYESVRELLDVENFMDYMILHFYADAEDWPHHNGYAARNVAGDGRFRFYIWDQEIVLDNLNMRRYDANQSNTPGELFQRLRQNPIFRTAFADRVHKHLSSGGALSLEASSERYRQVAERIDKAIVAESARWGDTQRSTPYGNNIDQPPNNSDWEHPNYPPAPHGPDYYFTREDSWLVEQDVILNQYLPAIYDQSRSNSLVRELQSEGLYPNVAPPVINPNGDVAPETSVSMDAEPAAEIYYTLDQSDPFRQAGLAIDEDVILAPPSSVRWLIPDSEDEGLTWVAADFDDAGWQSGFTGVGYETSPADYQDLIQSNVIAMRGQTGSVYVRIPFDVESAHLSEWSRLILDMKYDDGFAAYLNGVRVAEANAPAALDSDSTAVASHSDNEAVSYETFDVSSFLHLLQPGRNVLAIHGLNVNTTSSDLLLAPRLAGTTSPGPASVGESAVRYTGPIRLRETTTVKARSFLNGEWSALSEALFIAALEAGPETLVVSELHYHPMNDDDLEFMELMNLHPDLPIHLGGLSFTEGVFMTFPLGAVLGPGERLVLAANPSVLREEGIDSNIQIYAYEGRLNNAGERVTLSSSAGELFSFVYQDAPPWPVEADGQGPSLVLVDPSSLPDPNLASSWRIGSRTNGTPGSGEYLDPPADPDIDQDGDGVSALWEFALGTSDEDPESGAGAIRVEIGASNGAMEPGPFFLVRIQRNRLANVSFSLESAADVTAVTWTETEMVLDGAEVVSPDVEILTYRSLRPIAEDRSMYVRAALHLEEITFR